jgi:hypothetical protein
MSNIIPLKEEKLTNVIKKIVMEVRGESQTPDAINFIEFMRRSLLRIYGKSNRDLINRNLNKYIEFIERHNLQDTKDLFSDFSDKYDPKRIERNNDALDNQPLINRPEDWKAKAQSDFEKYYASIQKQNKLVDPYMYESMKIHENIKYMLGTYFHKQII